MTAYQFTPQYRTPNDRYESRDDLYHQRYRFTRPSVTMSWQDAPIRPRCKDSAASFRLSVHSETHSVSDATGDASEGTYSITALQTQVRSLSREIEYLQEVREHYVAEAMGNVAAMFILQKVVEAEDLDLDVFTRNLTAPRGWVSFALLWRANLIDCYGDLVMPTDAGVETAKLFALTPADRVAEPSADSSAGG